MTDSTGGELLIGDGVTPGIMRIGDELPRAEAWLRRAGPAITARLTESPRSPA